MEGKGELINNFESKVVKELKGELAEAYKIIAEKEEENQRLREEIGLLKKKRLFESEGDDREPEGKPLPMLERKAEEIIPKECWGIVFQNLDAEDLVSCRQVCRTFNQVLDGREFKEKWKFHLVFPLLYPYLKSRVPGSNYWQHIYKARLVCRSWRHSIDHFATGESARSGQMPLLTYFETCADLEKFQEKFGACNTNPFPSRSVDVSNENGRWTFSEEDEDEEEDEGEEDDYHNARPFPGPYIEKVGEVLRQFGKHIFLFRLRWCFENKQKFVPDPLTLCKLIKRITIHLPNLKDLQIFKQLDDKDKENEVATYIEENPLAALPRLEGLRISGLDKKVEDYLLDAFVSQLTQLDMRFSRNLLNQLRIQQLKNVRKLWLELREPSDIGNFRFLESPLKLLKLHCGFKSAQVTLNMDALFRNLKHLPIQDLEIHLCLCARVNVEDGGIDIEEYYNASIKKLILHIDRPHSDDGNQISFNFLQALTTLENLELKFTREEHHPLTTTHPGEVPEVVKLNEYLFGEEEAKSPYRSNVWEKVPSLKTLKKWAEVMDGDEFDKSIYTREKYERFRFIAEGDGPERD